MSHYACNRCGKVASATRGMCDACTPEAVIKAADALTAAEEKAGYRFDKSNATRRKAYIRAATVKQQNALARAKREHNFKAET